MARSCTTKVADRIDLLALRGTHFAAFPADSQAHLDLGATKENLIMLITKKMLIGLALVVALVGAGIGSLITHSAQNTEAANSSYQTVPTTNAETKTPEQLEAANSTQFATTAEQTAYRQGFNEGFNSCQTASTNSGSQ